MKKNFLSLLLILVFISNFFQNFIYGHPRKVTLDNAIGQILDIYNPNYTKTKLYIIEDFHCAPYVQKNIKKILKRIKAEHGCIDIIGIEGSFDELKNVKIFRKMPAPLRDLITNGLTAKGYLTGAELYGIKNPETKLIGIEDESLYIKNFTMLYKNLLHRELLGHMFKKTERIISKAKYILFLPNMLELEKYKNHYKTGAIRLDEYLNKLINNSSPNNLYKHIRNYLKLVDMEKKIISERNIGRNLPANYLELKKRIYANRLFAETDILEYETMNKKAGGIKDLEDLIYLAKFMNLLKGYISNSITKPETEAWQSGKARFYEILDDLGKRLGIKQELTERYEELTLALENITNFYNTANKRNEIMVNNMLNHIKNNPNIYSVNVMILGGFHTRGVTQILRSKGIGYTVIRPNPGNKKIDKKTYINRLKNQAKFLNLDIQEPELTTTKRFNNLMHKINTIKFLAPTPQTQPGYMTPEFIDEISNILKQSNIDDKDIETVLEILGYPTIKKDGLFYLSSEDEKESSEEVEASSEYEKESNEEVETSSEYETESGEESEASSEDEKESSEEVEASSEYEKESNEEVETSSEEDDGVFQISDESDGEEEFIDTIQPKFLLFNETESYFEKTLKVYIMARRIIELYLDPTKTLVKIDVEHDNIYITYWDNTLGHNVLRLEFIDKNYNIKEPRQTTAWELNSKLLKTRKLSIANQIMSFKTAIEQHAINRVQFFVEDVGININRLLSEKKYTALDYATNPVIQKYLISKGARHSETKLRGLKRLEHGLDIEENFSNGKYKCNNKNLFYSCDDPLMRLMYKDFPNSINILFPGRNRMRYINKILTHPLLNESFFVYTQTQDEYKNFFALIFIERIRDVLYELTARLSQTRNKRTKKAIEKEIILLKSALFKDTKELAKKNSNLENIRLLTSLKNCILAIREKETAAYTGKFIYNAILELELVLEIMSNDQMPQELIETTNKLHLLLLTTGLSPKEPLKLKTTKIQTQINKLYNNIYPTDAKDSLFEKLQIITDSIAYQITESRTKIFQDSSIIAEAKLLNTLLRICFIDFTRACLNTLVNPEHDNKTIKKVFKILNKNQKHLLDTAINNEVMQVISKRLGSTNLKEREWIIKNKTVVKLKKESQQRADVLSLFKQNNISEDNEKLEGTLEIISVRDKAKYGEEIWIVMNKIKNGKTLKRNLEDILDIEDSNPRPSRILRSITRLNQLLIPVLDLLLLNKAGLINITEYKNIETDSQELVLTTEKKYQNLISAA